jgi:serine/threonine-protein kinase HipA
MALLSNDLPLVDTEHAPPGRLAADQARAVGAVDDARPDRWGEKVIRYINKPKRHSLMEYLYYAGDDRFGALGVSTSATDYTPRAGSPLPRLEQAQALSDAVARIEASEPLNALQAKLVRVGSSLGGAKPKALIEITGEQWECIIGFRNADSRGRAATK